MDLEDVQRAGAIAKNLKVAAKRAEIAGMHTGHIINLQIIYNEHCPLLIVTIKRLCHCI